MTKVAIPMFNDNQLRWQKSSWLRKRGHLVQLNQSETTEIKPAPLLHGHGFELLDADGGDFVFGRLRVTVAVRGGDLVQENARGVERGIDFAVLHGVADLHGQISRTLLAAQANNLAVGEAEACGVGGRELKIVG